MTNCIEIKGLVKEYKTFTLGPIDLKVPGGSIMGLIGENGAGKTTLIKSMLGVTRPTAGEASLLGTDPDRAKEDIGIVLDDCFFSEYLRVKDVDSVLRRVFKGWDRGLFRDYLDKFGLAGSKNIKELSRGMRMKLSLAAALAHRPKLLLLDEATAGLDPVVREEILDEFLAFVSDEDHAILISSHITSDLEKVADYIAYLHQGKLLLCDEKDRLLEDYGVFVGTAEQAESLLPEAVIGREARDYGGVRALVKRGMVPETLALERPTVEEIILFIVKGENGR